MRLFSAMGTDEVIVSEDLGRTWRKAFKLSTLSSDLPGVNAEYVASALNAQTFLHAPLDDLPPVFAGIRDAVQELDRGPKDLGPVVEPPEPAKKVFDFEDPTTWPQGWQAWGF